MEPDVIEMDSFVEEQNKLIENADILEARKMLVPILRQKRDDTEKNLSQEQMMILRSCFEKYHKHSSNLQEFYNLVKDLTDVPSMETIMDQLNEMEKELVRTIA